MNVARLETSAFRYAIASFMCAATVGPRKRIIMIRIS